MCAPMCTYICVYVIFMCVCDFYVPQSSGSGFKIKRTSQNKDIKTCSLKSVSYSAFSSNSKVSWYFIFLIYKFLLCCENSSTSAVKITSLCIQGHNEIT